MERKSGMNDKGRFQMKKMVCLVFALFFMSVGHAFADYLHVLLRRRNVQCFGDPDYRSRGRAFHGDRGHPKHRRVYRCICIPAQGRFLPGPMRPVLRERSITITTSPPASTPIVSNPGLLFTVGSFGTPGYNEINIFGNGGANNYSYYEGTAAGNYPVVYNNGTFTVTQASSVPVPPAAWLLGSGLFGLIGIRRRLGK